VSPVLLDTLELGDRLGSGGQGSVHQVRNRKINDRWAVAYKEYNAAAQDAADIDALTAMVELIPALPSSTAEWLCTMAAWPAALVERQGRITGFLMRTVPDEFYFDYRGFDGKATHKLTTAEFLLNNDSYARSIGLRVDERQRLRLLADLAAKLSRLHTLGIAVGDLSPKNLLFTAGARPSCFLIDCDAMRINGRSVLPQAETPDWQVPAGEEKGTPSSDAYKLALLAVRVFARDQTSRDPAVLPAAAEPKLAELARAALSGQAGDRPPPGEWAEYCLNAASSPHLVITSVATGPPGAPAAGNSAAGNSAAGNAATAASGQAVKPAGGGLTPRAQRVMVAATVAVLALVVIVVVAVNSGGHAVAHATSAPPTYTYATPPDPTPSDSLPPATPSPSPASDPNSKGTDLTPFTVGSLLPDSFTDSEGDNFTLVSSGPASCIESDQTSTVQGILNKYNCVSQMDGSYTNDAGTILVSVEVMPLSDTSAAQGAQDAIKQAGFHAGDLGLWCPKSGTGSVCDSRNFYPATKYGYYGYSYRYFMNADAIWINLSQDTSSSAYAPLQAASKAALLAAGPQNYPGNP